MPVIKIQTFIQAPAARCFDLARSIDLHTISTQSTGEKAIAGRTSGLIQLGETVTWRARHFGIWQKLTVKITALEASSHFVDEMVKGAFKSFEHQHRFDVENGVTVMTDIFTYTSPLGWLGRLADALFLQRYMQKLLIERNEVIKAYAESDKWRLVLK
ncbi:SRPBCC family protein [Mucilaginibacter sp. Bleaf8]|uniref:SRPBCC family protein n=1 Tax=Mucilaginibacter sp. Bleaf8 TaxID=2834430 RepID=UPI001BD0999E|nr:SRPBCC family protein [Mucilaginibacter sp. Bleaf8]MBS7565293.1 SRPBCC family protein [Mucilaginibacter sp. Bleaf8]